MAIDPTSTAFGAAIGAGTTIAVSLINRWFDERRERRDWVSKIAVQNWDAYKEAARKYGGDVEPVEVFVVHAAKLFEIIDGDYTPHEIRTKMRELRAVVAEVAKHSLPSPLS